MRAGFTCVFALLALAGCGYVGPVLPPSPLIPSQVTDLSAVEEGGRIVVTFRTPPRTTDSVAIKRFSDVDLRVGSPSAPFDFDNWSKTAKLYPLALPPPNDPADPQPLPMRHEIPAQEWLGKRIAVAVRTAVRSGDHYSAWSNRVVLDVVEPLSEPTHLRIASVAGGVALEWEPVPGAKSYRILRQGPGDKAPVEIGNAEGNRYVDPTAQFDVEYVYTVLAANGTAQSLASETKKITPLDKFPPSVPSGLTALAGPQAVEVSWQRSPEADLQGYYIYRSVGEGKFERLGGMLNLPTFSDAKVERGKTYRYRISALDSKMNESEPSTAVQVAF